MNARHIKGVKIVNAAIDETRKGDIILRGVVDNESLQQLLVDDYQREGLPLTSLSSILDALQNGEDLPDIELGMRGSRTRSPSGDEYLLLDDVYIVDGQQRVRAAMHMLSTSPETQVRIGATIHFDTSVDWERSRFHTLNTARKKVSPNVILRNKRSSSASMLMLYGLTTNDKQFVLYQRVSWAQRAARSELLTALTLAKTVGRLHAHKARAKRTDIDELVPALDRAVEIVGIQNMRANIRTFFDLIDECWGIRRIHYREGACYIHGTFLFTLAQFLSDHKDFWREDDEKKLFIEASLRRKIAQFAVRDPHVMNLSSSGGKSSEMLYQLLLNHVNSGKRTRRLVSRHAELVTSIDEEDDEEAAA